LRAVRSLFNQNSHISSSFGETVTFGVINAVDFQKYLETSQGIKDLQKSQHLSGTLASMLAKQLTIALDKGKGEGKEGPRFRGQKYGNKTVFFNPAEFEQGFYKTDTNAAMKAMSES